MLDIEMFRESDTPPGLRRQVLQLQDEAWPLGEGEIDESRQVHDPALRPLSMLLVANQKTVVSALDVLFKQIDHAGRRLSAAGLSSVVTRSASRGQGHGQTLVTHARQVLPLLGVDVVLFTCDRPLGDFYQACGWEVLDGSVLIGGTVEDPFRSDQPGFDKVVLGGFFTPLACLAREALVGASIELFSGDIDKLW